MNKAIIGWILAIALGLISTFVDLSPQLKICGIKIHWISASFAADGIEENKSENRTKEISDEQLSSLDGIKPSTTLESLRQMLPMFVVVFGIYYWLVVRRQLQEENAQVKLITNLKAGDHVITAGGIIGKVIGARSNNSPITLELAKGLTVKIDEKYIVALHAGAAVESNTATARKVG